MHSSKSFSHVPYPIGTEEWKSFLNYAKAYYKEVYKVAVDLLDVELGINAQITGESAKELAYRYFQSILNAVMSPLVYLWEKWQLMTPEQKMTYATEDYKKQLQNIIAERDTTMQKLKEQMK
jgi:hypothetical protein